MTNDQGPCRLVRQVNQIGRLETGEESRRVLLSLVVRRPNGGFCRMNRQGPIAFLGHWSLVTVLRGKG
jgi:hypothetical protein